MPINAQTLKELEKLYSKDELLDLIKVRREEREAEERAARSVQRNVAKAEIKQHLIDAEYHLRKAGELGDQYSIDFSFVDAKNYSQTFRAGWQSSACYMSDGWFADSVYGEGSGSERTPSTVDGEPIEAVNVEEYELNNRWQSSSMDC